jgi:hypothetical protein
MNIFYCYDTTGAPISDGYCCVMNNAVRWFSLSKPDSMIAEYKYADYRDKPFSIHKTTNIKWGSSPYEFYFLAENAIISLDIKNNK